MRAYPFPGHGLQVGELLVREPTAADVPAVAPAFLDPSVGGEAGLPPLPEPALLAFLERDLPQLRAIGYTLALVIADAGASIVGGATLNRHDPLRSRVEVGYWLYPAARGRGIATRVVRALAQHAFSVGLVRVDALIRPENTASIRVVERAGFAREGLLRAGLRHGEGWTDALLYAAVSAG